METYIPISIKDILTLFTQATHVTLLCPMRFNRYPLDYHTCKFMVGSSNYDETRMTFSNLKLYFDQEAANTIVDYKIEISGEL